MCEELVAELAEPSSLERWNARESYLMGKKKKKLDSLSAIIHVPESSS